MITRLSVGRVEPWELALSVGLLVGTIAVVGVIAIRVYAAGSAPVRAAARPARIRRGRPTRLRAAGALAPGPPRRRLGFCLVLEQEGQAPDQRDDWCCRGRGLRWVDLGRGTIARRGFPDGDETPQPAPDA